MLKFPRRHVAIATSVFGLSLAPQLHADPAAISENYGAVQHLPQSTEGFLGFYNLAEAVERLSKTEVAAVLRLALEQNGMTIEDALKTPEYLQSLPFWGEEVFFAFGEGSVEQGKLLMELSQASNHATGLQLAMGLKAVIEGGSLGPADHYAAYLKQNPGKIVELVESAKMPPITIGSKIPADERNQVVAQIGQVLPMAMMANQEAEIVSMVMVEQAGSTFNGVKIDGKALMSVAGEDLKENLTEVFSADEADSIVAALADNTLVLLYGVVGDYLLVHLGSDEANFQLAGAVGDSLASSGELDFLNDHAAADAVSMLFASKDAVSISAEYGSALADIFEGFKAGLAQEEIFGDTQELDLMLDRAATQERELMKVDDYARFGSVAFVEDGFKVESYGGRINKLLTDKKHALSELGEAENLALFSVGDVDEEAGTELFDYLATVTELAYMVGGEVAAIENINDGDVREFIEGFKMFDQHFKADALELVSAFREDLDAGLKSEAALVIDLEGSMPPVPNVPKALVEKGKVPRIAWISEVEDRARVAKSWERMNGAITRILEKASEMSGEQINMLRPMTIPRDGLDSHFFAMPFFDGGFSPSASVSDTLFVLSTSTDYSAELAKSVDTDQDGLTGSFAQLNFDNIAAYGLGWVELLAAEGKGFMGEYEYEDFIENREVIESSLKSLGALGNLKVHTRTEDGQSRSSLHVQAK